MSSLQCVMSIRILFCSLCRRVPSVGRLCQHQVGISSVHTVTFCANDSPSIALYGLIVFYGLTKEELVGRRPLAKFLSIKLIVVFTFYQSFVVCYVRLR